MSLWKHSSLFHGARNRLILIRATHMVSALPSCSSSSSISVTVGLQGAGVRKVGEEGEQSISLGSVMAAHLSSPSA